MVRQQIGEPLVTIPPHFHGITLKFCNELPIKNRLYCIFKPVQPLYLAIELFTS